MTEQEKISIITANRRAINKAKEVLSNASYQSECGVNEGLRTIFSNQADWLSKVIYLAEKQLKAEEVCLNLQDQMSF
jgi:hypothetical protein